MKALQSVSGCTSTGIAECPLNTDTAQETPGMITPPKNKKI